MASFLLDAVNVGAVGVMIAVLLQFGRDIGSPIWRTAVIAAFTGILYFGF